MNADLYLAPENTTLSSKSQLVIPKAMRERVQWAAGDQLHLILVDEEIRLRRVQSASKSRALEDVAACLKAAMPCSGVPQLSDADIKKRIGQRLKARLSA